MEPIQITALDEGYILKDGNGRSVALGSPEELAERLWSELNVPNPEKYMAALWSRIIIPSESSDENLDETIKAKLEAKIKINQRRKEQVKEAIKITETTRDKVLKLALEQINLTGNIIQAKVAKELKISPATVSIYLKEPGLVEKIEAAQKAYQDERDRPMLNTNTHISEDGGESSET